jgi:hypothetical protein
VVSFECDSCRRSFTTAPNLSVTGRRLCDSCNDQLLGATAGAISGGISGAISTAGWYSKLRRMARKAPSGGDQD